jgi:hypothetical protein
MSERRPSRQPGERRGVPLAGPGTGPVESRARGTARPSMVAHVDGTVSAGREPHLRRVHQRAPPQNNGLLPNGDPKGGSPAASTLLLVARMPCSTDPGFKADQARILATGSLRRIPTSPTSTSRTAAVTTGPSWPATTRLQGLRPSGVHIASMRAGLRSVRLPDARAPPQKRLYLAAALRIGDAGVGRLASTP